MASCKGAVSRVWRSVIARAVKGSDRAAHMVALRYDLPYREAVQKAPTTGPKGTFSSDLSHLAREINARTRKRGGARKQRKEEAARAGDKPSVVAAPGAQGRGDGVDAQETSQAKGGEGG